MCFLLLFTSMIELTATRVYDWLLYFFNKTLALIFKLYIIYITNIVQDTRYNIELLYIIITKNCNKNKKELNNFEDLV